MDLPNLQGLVASQRVQHDAADVGSVPERAIWLKGHQRHFLAELVEQLVLLARLGQIDATRLGKHLPNQLGCDAPEDQARMGEFPDVRVPDAAEEPAVEVSLDAVFLNLQLQPAPDSEVGDALVSDPLCSDDLGRQLQAKRAAANLLREPPGKVRALDSLGSQQALGSIALQVTQPHLSTSEGAHRGAARDHGTQTGHPLLQFVEHVPKLGHPVAAAVLHHLEGVQNQKEGPLLRDLVNDLLQICEERSAVKQAGLHALVRAQAGTLQPGIGLGTR